MKALSQFLHTKLECTNYPMSRGDGRTDGRTDRQTDRRTDKLNPISLRFTGDNKGLNSEGMPYMHIKYATGLLTGHLHGRSIAADVTSSVRHATLVFASIAIRRRVDAVAAVGG